MISEFEKLARRVADLEHRVKGMARHGTVEEVDPGGGLVRLKIGETDSGPVLTGWIPYSQTAGAMKFHNPPSVGQQMTAMSPNGDLRQATAMPLGWSDAEASPSGAGDQHVMTFGSVTVTLEGDSVTIETGAAINLTAGSEIVMTGGGVEAKLDGSGFAVTGGQVTHNGTDIGDTHTHSGIVPGPSRTGDPK